MNKLVSITPHEEEVLMGLLDSTLEETIADQEPDEEYMDTLESIAASVAVGIPSPLDVVKMENEIHALKNQITQLKLELSMKTAPLHHVSILKKNDSIEGVFKSKHEALCEATRQGWVTTDAQEIHLLEGYNLQIMTESNRCLMIKIIEERIR